MKIRTGFVSNSSSSSFIIITSKENHERVLKDLHPFYQEVIKIMSVEKNFFGKDMVYTMNLTDRGGNSTLFGEYSSVSEIEYKGEKPEEWDEDERDFNSIHYNYVKKLKEKPEEIFEAREDL